MDERITYNVDISIDTSDGIGATSVYGTHEFLKMLRVGCKANGYTLDAGYPEHEEKRGDKSVHELLVIITKEK